MGADRNDPVFVRSNAIVFQMGLPKRYRSFVKSDPVFLQVLSRLFLIPLKLSELIELCRFHRLPQGLSGDSAARVAAVSEGYR
ncbi:MAG: hypothetical protein ABIK36_20465 [Pseudomonadota bacterium]